MNMEKYSEPNMTLYLGDCREVLRSLEPESVDVMICSPPY